MYIRRSEDVLDVFCTSYVRSIYVLCLLGTAIANWIISQEILLKEDNEIFLKPRIFGLNLCHTFSNMNLLSWIFFLHDTLYIEGVVSERAFSVTEQLYEYMHLEATIIFYLNRYKTVVTW